MATPQSAPIPPPLPPQHRHHKTSIALKVKAAPPGWASEGRIVDPAWDFVDPPAGFYFFYGTLQDPELLREILGLYDAPSLRPAQIVGYKVRLWGQYPAIVDFPYTVVKGSIYEVIDESTAAKLAAYETSNYRPAPCIIDLVGDDGEERIDGYVFKFCGNFNDLTDGEFDLTRWLQLMGRSA